MRPLPPPVLRSVSVVVPQARVLNVLKYAATGTYAFVGSATAEAKVTDSQTGELLAAWADQRFGGVSVKNVTVWQQGDAENANELLGQRSRSKTGVFGRRRTILGEYGRR